MDARAPTWTSATRCGARRTTPAAGCWSRCCSPAGVIGDTSTGPSTSPCCSFATEANTDAGGQTFRSWLTTGRLSSGEKMQPTLSHWVDHLTTLFPEVRVKRVLEVRGADVVPLPL